MSPALSDRFRHLFGSETRARLLGLLADSEQPLTGYAIAKRLRVPPSKAYRQLPGLLASGVLEVIQDERGVKRYVLVDGDLRRFLQKRVRVTTAEEWFSPGRARRKRKAYDRLRRREVPPPRTRPHRAAVSNPEEYERPPEKDRALRRLDR
ncbi:MAG: helix-turn-helix domain-containing protein [Thermoplasmata archaeon]